MHNSLRLLLLPIFCLFHVGLVHGNPVSLESVAEAYDKQGKKAAEDWAENLKNYEFSPEGQAETLQRVKGYLAPVGHSQFSRLLREAQRDPEFDVIAFWHFIDQLEGTDYDIIRNSPLYAVTLLEDALGDKFSYGEWESRNCNLIHYALPLLKESHDDLSREALSLLYGYLTANLVRHQCVTRAIAADLCSLNQDNAPASLVPYLDLLHLAGHRHLNVWEEEPKAVAIERLQKVFSRKDLHPGVKMMIARGASKGMAGTHLVHETRDVYLDLLADYADSLDEDYHISPDAIFMLARSLDLHPLNKKEHNETFRKFLAPLVAKQKYESEQNNGETFPSTNNPLEMRLLILAREEGREEEIEALLNENFNHFHKRYEPICVLIEGDYDELALTLLPEKDGILGWRRTYTLSHELRYRIQRFLKKVEDPGLRLYLEIGIRSAVNRMNPRSPGYQADDRLREIAERGIDLSLLSDEQRIDVLATYSFYPELAAPFDQAYRDWAADYDFVTELPKAQREQPGDKTTVDILHTYRRTWGQQYTAMRGLQLLVLEGKSERPLEVVSAFRSIIEAEPQGNNLGRAVGVLSNPFLMRGLANVARMTPEVAMETIEFHHEWIILSHLRRSDLNRLRSLAMGMMVHYIAKGHLDDFDKWLSEQDDNIQRSYANLRESKRRWKVLESLKVRSYTRRQGRLTRVKLFQHLYNNPGKLWQLVEDDSIFGFREALGERMLYAQDIDEVIREIDDTHLSAVMLTAGAAHLSLRAKERENAMTYLEKGREMLGAEASESRQQEFDLLEAEVMMNTGHMSKARSLIEGVLASPANPIVANRAKYLTTLLK